MGGDECPVARVDGHAPLREEAAQLQHFNRKRFPESGTADPNPCTITPHEETTTEEGLSDAMRLLMTTPRRSALADLMNWRPEAPPPMIPIPDRSDPQRVAKLL